MGEMKMSWEVWVDPVYAGLFVAPDPLFGSSVSVRQPTTFCEIRKKKIYTYTP